MWIIEKYALAKFQDATTTGEGVCDGGNALSTC